MTSAMVCVCVCVRWNRNVKSVGFHKNPLVDNLLTQAAKPRVFENKNIRVHRPPPELESVILLQPIIKNWPVNSFNQLTQSKPPASTTRAWVAAWLWAAVRASMHARGGGEGGVSEASLSRITTTRFVPQLTTNKIRVTEYQHTCYQLADNAVN